MNAMKHEPTIEQGPELRHVDEIFPNRLNPRGPVEESDPDLAGLAQSMRENGILQPLLITPDGVIVAGHRRHAAARLAEISMVPVYVRALDEKQQLEAMLVENLQREALNPVQTAKGCQDLRDRGATIEQIAVRTGLRMETVRRHLALLTLPAVLQERCAAGELPLGYVLELVKLPTAELQVKVAFDAMRERWYVEQLARLVDKIVGPPPRKYPVIKEPPAPKTTARMIELFTELTTEFQRHPEHADSPAIAGWLERLNAAARRS